MTTSDSSPILTGATHDDSSSDSAPPVIALLGWTATADTLTVELAGEVDHFSAAALRPILAGALAAGCTHLVLDTARVTFADSALLSLIAPWHRAGHQLTLRGPSTPVRRLIEVTAASRTTSARPSAAPRPRTTAARVLSS